MAPYRPNGQSRRSGARGYVDHDFYEGLPVRHWRRSTVQVGVPPKPESASRLLQPELPLPKEANLLTPMSRALLQAARAGTINKTPPAEEEAVVKEGEEDEGDEERGFVASRWSLVPRHLEGPEPEYLAKKRKGLDRKASTGANGAGAGGGAIKKAKIRRTDTEGGAYPEEIVITDGPKAEGEPVTEVAVADAGLLGTVAEGTGVANPSGVVMAMETVQPTPPRRRPPPPRRKPKAPGRGRKKKVQFVPGAEGTADTGARGAALATANLLTEDGQPSTSVLPVGGPEGTFEHDDGDTEMIDDPSLRDGDEDDDDNEEGEEGDEIDDDDREEGELTPSPTPDDTTSYVTPNPSKFNEVSTLAQPIVSALSHPPHSLPDVQMLAADPLQRSTSSSPDLPLAAGQRIDFSIKGEVEAPTSVPLDGGVTTSIEVPTTAQEDKSQDVQDEEGLINDFVQMPEVAMEEDPPLDDLIPGEPLQDTALETPTHEGLMLEDLIQDSPVQQDPIQSDSEQMVSIPEDLKHDGLIREDPKLEDLIQEELLQPCLIQGGSEQGDSIKQESNQEDLIYADLIQEDLVQKTPTAQEDLVDEGPLQTILLQGESVPSPQIERSTDPENELTPQGGDNTALVDTVTHDIEVDEEVHFPDGDIDLFGSLEKHLEEHSSAPGADAESSPTAVGIDILGKDDVVGEGGDE